MNSKTDVKELVWMLQVSQYISVRQLRSCDELDSCFIAQYTYVCSDCLIGGGVFKENPFLCRCETRNFLNSFTVYKGYFSFKYLVCTHSKRYRLISVF